MYPIAFYNNKNDYDDSIDASECDIKSMRKWKYPLTLT